MNFRVLLFCFFAAQSQFSFALNCDEFINSLPENSIHGFIDVPENWFNKHFSKKIKVFYYGYNFTEKNKGTTPIVYFNGGPGGYAHQMHKYIIKDPERLKYYSQIPFIFIDQRGTGCSAPLPKVEKVTSRSIRTIARYGARFIVYDSEALRKKLGYEKWRVFGQSYGSLIVHRYIELRPYALKAAYAHGISVMTSGIAWTAERVLAFKRLGDMYFSIYPDDKTKLDRIKELFPREYCSDWGSFKVCGPALLDELGWNNLSYKNWGTWEILHKQINSFFKESGELDLEVVKKFFPKKGQYPLEKLLLVDVVPGREAPGGLLNTWSCEKAMPMLRARGVDVDSFDFNECRHALAIERSFNYNAIRRIARQDYVSLSMIKDALEETKIPFYLYSAELDFFGPEAGFKQEVEYLGNLVKYRAYKNSDHAEYFEEIQTWKDFLTTN